MPDPVQRPTPSYGPAIVAAYELLTAAEHWAVDAQRLSAYLGRELERADRQILFGKTEDDRGTAVAVWRELEFDSAIFSRSMGRIDWVAAPDLDHPVRTALLRETLDAATARGVVHLTLRVSARDSRLIHAAEEAGFRTVTAFVGLSRAVELDPGPAEPRVRAADAADRVALQEITGEAFASGTRFHMDPTLPAVDTARLHQCWIENCLAGRAADVVLAGMDGGRVAGYITCSVDAGARECLGQARGSIGLFAAASHARGRGLGQALLRAALDWLGERGVERAEVGTESINYGALRAYARAGFRPVQSCVTLHRWG